jgi:hypothetical protein
VLKCKKKYSGAKRLINDYFGDKKGYEAKEKKFLGL